MAVPSKRSRRFEMSAILLVWQILLVSLPLFSFPEEQRGLDLVASAVLLSGSCVWCCRLGDLGRQPALLPGCNAPFTLKHCHCLLGVAGLGGVLWSGPSCWFALNSQQALGAGLFIAGKIPF